MQASTHKCLARGEGEQRAQVSAVACDPASTAQAWELGRANTTVWQVRDAADGSSSKPLRLLLISYQDYHMFCVSS